MGLFSGLHTKVAVYAIYRIVSAIFVFDPRGQWIVVAIVLTMIVGGFGPSGNSACAVPWRSRWCAALATS